LFWIFEGNYFNNLVLIFLFMDLERVSDYVWDMPKKDKMVVPGRVFASEKLINLINRDKTLEQVKNVACLKGIEKFSFAMPDAHQGYGFPIGGVAAFDSSDGIISPGGIGYDINCGVRLLKVNLSVDEVLSKRSELLKELFFRVPPSVGKKGLKTLSKDEYVEVLNKGSKWCLDNGFATKDDLDRTEEFGFMKSADASFVSERCFTRGKSQLGTLGSGNHFLELQKVGEVFDSNVANVFGLGSDCCYVMIHTGSRGLGHQIAGDYIKLMEEKFGFSDLPDRELINAPFNSDLGQEYFKAMCAGMNFAFANRQFITYNTRVSFNKVFDNNIDVSVVYDLCHNTAKVEEHVINGEKRNFIVHRKGATRSFGPSRKEVNDVYSEVGQPVLIPGSMGTSSYVLVGTDEALDVSFGSTAHGAGRVMSRSSALRSLKGEEVIKKLSDSNIEVRSASVKGVAEEAPEVYKDVDEVVKVSDSLKIGRLVSKMLPLGVIKG